MDDNNPSRHKQILRARLAVGFCESKDPDALSARQTARRKQTCSQLVSRTVNHATRRKSAGPDAALLPMSEDSGVRSADSVAAFPVRQASRL
jgi:hypothetical protein